MARILVADDDVQIRRLIRTACESEGHETAEAHDTATAVSSYDAYRPDLLVLDLQMPGGGGLEALAQLRFAHARELCPVLVVSGHLDLLSDEEQRAIGAADVARKPFRIDDLLDRIRRLVPGA